MSQMAGTVFILGAGFSRYAGMPLVLELREEVLEWLRLNADDPRVSPHMRPWPNWPEYHRPRCSCSIRHSSRRLLTHSQCRPRPFHSRPARHDHQPPRLAGRSHGKRPSRLGAGPTFHPRRRLTSAASLRPRHVPAAFGVAAAAHDLDAARLPFAVRAAVF